MKQLKVLELKLTFPTRIFLHTETVELPLENKRKKQKRRFKGERIPDRAEKY